MIVKIALVIYFGAVAVNYFGPFKVSMFVMALAAAVVALAYLIDVIKS